MRAHYHYLLLWLAMVGPVLAESGKEYHVIGFDDIEIEARDGERYFFLPVTEIGQPPLTIVDDDGAGFVKIRGRNGKTYWLGRSYLQTDEPFDVPTCNDQALGGAPDRTMASVRGMGENCQ